MEVIPVKTKRPYRRISVNDVDRAKLLLQAKAKGHSRIAVGLDIGKSEIVAALKWADGAYESPWNVVNPLEIGSLVDLLVWLSEHSKELTVGLESTGTYGDAVRYALTNKNLQTHRISGKASSDYKEIFDGVASGHDGKDAAIIAELTLFGKGTPWPYVPPSDAVEEMRYHCQMFLTQLDEKIRWIGRLEGLLARHWPELTEVMELGSATLPRMLLHYGSPAAVAADPEAAAQLRRWGGSRLAQSKIDAIVDSAHLTTGLPMIGHNVLWLQEIASQIQSSRLAMQNCRKKLTQLALADKKMAPYAKIVGAPSLCSLWVSLGDPRNYHSSGAYLKACGLNLKERSSGRHQGKLKITKRGPGLARKALYFWAMRAVQKDDLSTWYKQFKRVGKGQDKRNSEHRQNKGLIALSRKLARSLWYVRKHDLEFDYSKVFPGKPLQPRRARKDTRRGRRKAR